MKIIKKGDKTEKPKKKSCHVCKTKFEYVKKDIESDRDGSYVKCPHCRAFIAVHQ